MRADRNPFRDQIVDLTILFVAAVLARIAVQVAVGFYVRPEAWEYDTLARNVVAGNGYVIEHDGTTHRAFTFPLYPLLLAGVYTVTGVVPYGVGLFQALLGGVLVALIYVFAWPMGRPVALLASAAVALHPGLLIYAAKIHALNLHAVLGAATAVVARWAWARPERRSAVVAGFVGGISGLERTIIAPTLGLALAAGGLRSIGTRATARLLAIWLIVSVAFVAPWLARNAIVVGAPLLTTTENEALWRGNNPRSTGGNLAADGRPMLDASPEMRERVYGKPDVVQNEIFGEAAFGYMTADPLRTALMTLRKAFYFWWAGPEVGFAYPAAWSALYLIYYVGVLALALVAVFAGAGIVDRASLVAVLFTAGPQSLLQALYYVEGRHRWAVEPLLVVLSAAGIVALARRWTLRGGEDRGPERRSLTKESRFRSEQGDRGSVDEPRRSPHVR